MAIAADTPVHLDLPDGSVDLCTWGFIVSKLTEVIVPIQNSLVAENSSLQQIETKLQSWIDEQD